MLKGFEDSAVRYVGGGYGHITLSREPLWCIHPKINTLAAVTGRQSISDPPLQQVSKPYAPQNPFPVPARKAFLPRPGMFWMLIDFSGIELCLIVNDAGDPDFIELLNNGGDPHAAAAECFYNGSAYPNYLHHLEKPDGWEFKGFAGETNPLFKKLLRTAAKNTHFAKHYGAGPAKAANTLYVTKQDAMGAYARYDARFPHVGEWPSRVRQEAKETGYVTTAFGRRVPVPRDKPYVAPNFKIQGSGADVLKVSMNHVSRALETRTHLARWNILVPIHDELILEGPLEDWGCREEIYRELDSLMTHCFDGVFQVPIRTECKVTRRTWADAVDLDKTLTGD